LKAKMQEEEARMQVSIQKLVDQHALEMKRAAAEHDKLLMQVVLRLASVEKEAAAASLAMRQQHARKMAQMEAQVSGQERRCIALAQAIGLKQVELDDVRGQLVGAERVRHILVRERDEPLTCKEELVEEVERMREQKQQQRLVGGGSHHHYGMLVPVQSGQTPSGHHYGMLVPDVQSGQTPSGMWAPWPGWGLETGASSVSLRREDHPRP